MIKSSTTSVTTSAGTTSLTYDYESRITQITYPSSATNTFTYNGLDTRVGKVDSAGTATYKRDGDYVTAPVLDDGFAKFTPGVSERRGSTSRFNHPDRMGSVLRQTGVAQGSAASRQYDAFGNVFGSSGTFVGPFGFAGNWGYQSDADSGLQLLGHRYYDPSTGRFLTRDPIKDGRNWYAYVENNPLTAVDPWGLSVLHGLILNAAPPTAPKFPPGESVDRNISIIEESLMPVMLPPFPGDYPTTTIDHASVVAKWIALVAPHGDWDYKRYEDDYRVYQDAGNFNYGATGRELGFSLEILLLAGDLLQAGGKDPEEDKIQIRLGYRYHEFHSKQ